MFIRRVTSLMFALSAAMCVANPGAAQPVPAVAGTVVDADGRPIADVEVEVRDTNGRVARARSASDGRFVVTGLAAGQGRLTALAQAWSPASTELAIPTDGDGVRITLEPAGVQETVVVIGSPGARTALHLASQDLLGSVDVIGADQLQRENVDLSYELLKKVPGVYVNDYNQGVVAGGIGMRGFNTEGDIMHVKLLVDGIPTNVNSGVGDLNAIFPFDIDRIELVKGTNDPRYGLLNIAGNVQVFTSPPGRYSKLKVLGGAFGTGDVQGSTAFATGRVSHVYFGGYRTSRGYRDNSDLDRYAFSGKWFYAPASDGWRVGLVARSYDFDTQAPGYLTLTQSQQQPRSSPAFSATDGGEQHTRHVGLHADRQVGTLAMSAKAYWQTFKSQRFVRFTAAAAQQERLENEQQTGALVTATWRPAALATRDAAISVGADIQAQDNVAQRYATVARARGATLRDQAFDFSNGGAYVMADARPISRLRVNAGLRADRIGGDFQNVLSGAQLPIIKYGTIWQPKLGALVAVVEGVNLYGNYGRSFQVGVGSGAYGLTPLDPSRNDGWEAGVRATPSQRLTVRLGVWGQDASDELRLKFDNSGDSENVGKTRRRGWNVELTARPHPTTYAWVTYTRQRATLVEPGATRPDLKGKSLNHLPPYTAKWGLDVTPTRLVTASFWTEAQGDYYLTTLNNGGRFGNRLLSNLDVFVKPHARLSLGAHVKNMFNGYHEYAWFDGAQTLHSPGERRALYLTTTVEF
jgi:iron complex outermembrane recepter protein